MNQEELDAEKIIEEIENIVTRHVVACPHGEETIAALQDISLFLMVSGASLFSIATGQSDTNRNRALALSLTSRRMMEMVEPSEQTKH